MRTGFLYRTGLLMAALLCLLCASPLAAKDKAPKAPKMSNIQGRVQNINKDGMTITVEAKGIRRDVGYSADTKFMHGHSNNGTPGAADQVKEGNYISCGGTYASGSTKLMAKECVYRDQK